MTVTANTPKPRMTSLMMIVRPTSWTSSRWSSPGRSELAATAWADENSWAGSDIRAMLARWTDEYAAVRMAAPQVRARRTITVGAWRSQVARIVRDDEVGGSNPLAPTIPIRCNRPRHA